MIQQVTRRVLEGFGRLYGIVGSVARVNELDVGAPVLIHDVSREAHISGGFFTECSVTVATAGGGANTFASLSRTNFLLNAEVAAKLLQAGLSATEVDTWLVGFEGAAQTANIANFDRLRIAINQGTLTGSGTIIPLKRYAAADVPFVSGGITFLRADTGDPNPFGWFRLPIFMPDDNTTAFLAQGTDNAGGPIELYAIFHVWVGPKGCPAPFV